MKISTSNTKIFPIKCSELVTENRQNQADARSREDGFIIIGNKPIKSTQPEDNGEQESFC